ncbi:MAG: DUF1062 domain-containing protein [Rhizobiaceae bacterium]
MSEILLVKWTIRPQEPPRPLLHCRRCSGTRSYKTGDRIRVNANGKRVDAWLIYRCTSCDGTWNRPILERRHVHSIDPQFLASLCANDAMVVDGIAFDIDDLKRWAPRLEEATKVVVAKEVLSGSAAQPGYLRILCVVPYPVTLRLDRLLADKLQLSRSRIHALEKSNALVVAASNSARALRKPVRDGMELLIKLPVHDADWITRAACDDADRL